MDRGGSGMHQGWPRADLNCYILLISLFTLWTVQRSNSTAAPIFHIRPDHVFSKGRLFYRDVYLDVSTSSVYVGAMNTLYRLWAKNINDTSNIDQFVEREIPPNDQAVMNCAYKIRDQETQCQNYLRVFARSSADNTLLVCGTNAYSPVVYKIKINSLQIVDDSTSGAAICPVGPNDNTTALRVEKGNPFDLPSIYAATVTDFTQTNRIIYRPPLVDQKGAILQPFMRTIHTDSKWLNEPNFVGSFDLDDQYVYFFFRESAVEFINCGKAVYSRVARICKKDTGGQFVLKQNWATFLKARLNCSIGGEFPFYFDEIQDVVQTTDKNGDVIFYATFTTSLGGGLYGSAVCAFTLKAINEVFDSGSFKDQASSSSVWLPVLVEHVPSPRPGQCVGDTKSISDTTLHFSKAHPLMDTTVSSLAWKVHADSSNDGNGQQPIIDKSSEPVYYKRDVVFGKIVVDRLGIGNDVAFVIFVATDQGEIYKILQYQENGHATNVRLLSIYKLPNQEPIRSMRISARQFLYVSQDGTVSQISLPNLCHTYTLCSSCSSDPYCEWDGGKDKCQPVSERLDDKYIRFGTSESRCKTQTKTIMKLAYPAETIYMSCSSSTELGSSRTIWTKDGRPVKPNLHRHFRTVDGGLVIVNMSSTDSGQYECVSEGQSLNVYKLKVNDVSCDMPQNVQSYKAVYKEWCREFQEYKYRVDEWVRQRNEQLQCVSGRNGLQKKLPPQAYNVHLTGRPTAASHGHNANEKKR